MGDRNALFIASEVRSGSTYIAEAIAYHFYGLYGHSLFDLTKEHFARLNDQSTSDEILGIYNSLYQDKYGWVTCKIMCPSLSIILRESRKSDPLNQSFFGTNSHWIFVRRRSRIEQAVSLAFARATGVWHSYVGEDNSAESALLGPKEIEDALRAILLSDTYLEALASLIPENRKFVLYYEDFLSNSQPFIAKLHGVLAPPDVGGQVDYVDATRIQRVGTARKHRAVAEFNAWLAENYHAVENRILTDAHGSVSKEEVLAYESKILTLTREVENLKRRLNGDVISRGAIKGHTQAPTQFTQKQLEKKG